MTDELVYVSPSTQDWNQYAGGGTGPSDSEEAWCRKAAAVTVEELTRHGVPSVLGGSVSAKVNALDANAKGATLYVAEHTNAGGGEGTEVWHHTGSTKGEALAEAVYARVAPVSNAPDRGVKASTKYIELNTPKAPSIIVEALFHDDPDEAQEMREDFAEFGLAVAHGVLDYLKIPVLGAGTPAPKPVPAPKPTPKPAPVSDPTIKLGARGAAVKTAQERLNAHGAALRLVVDGIFGPKTDAAVRAFQKASKLTVDGIVGPNTWKALKAAPKPLSTGRPFTSRRLLKLANPMMKGADVKGVQGYLIRKGYSCGRSGADGVYGPATADAVRRYQTKRLPRYIRGANQWDGIVGPRTWALIDAGK